MAGYLLKALKITFFGSLFISASLFAEQKCVIPFEATYPADKALTAYEQGYNSYKEGKFDKAREFFITALKHEPNLVKAHYWLGKLYREAGELESAIFHWEEVERLNRLINFRRTALKVQNNEYPAHKQILKTIKSRNEAKEHFEKGLYLLDKGHWDGAEVEVREAVRLYPGNKQYIRTLARILWDKKEVSASIKFYRTLLSIYNVSYQDFQEGIKKMFAADMKYVAAPLVMKHKSRFSKMPGFDRICHNFAEELKTDIVSAGKIVSKHNGQVVVDIGFEDGINLNDEYSLKLRAFNPGKAIIDPDSGKIIGRTNDRATADLLITKVNRKSSWALIKREMGPGLKAGDLIEIKKTIRTRH